VADQHRRGDLVGHLAQARDQLVRAGTVELVLIANVRRDQRGLDALERLARAARGRAEDELGDEVMLAQVARDRLGGAPSPFRQRPVVVRQSGLVPAGLGVAQEVEALRAQRCLA
jgi:hypothetical protein